MILPPRVATTHLVYRGDRVVLVSRRSGKHLDFRVPVDDPEMPRYLGFIRVMLTRDASPVPVLTIEKINGKSAAGRPYRAVFERAFDTAATHRTLTVARRYGAARLTSPGLHVTFRPKRRLLRGIENRQSSRGDKKEAVDTLPNASKDGA